MLWSLSDDLSSIVKRTEPLLAKLSGEKIFITGGTGFIGRWLLESLKYAQQDLNFEFDVTILTRDIDAFKLLHPDLYNFKSFNFLSGDVINFKSQVRDFSYIIHAATESATNLNNSNPLRMFETVVDGTRRILDFANNNNTKKFLYLSSGAVYGQQPWNVESLQESWLGGPDVSSVLNAYAESKRAAEMLCSIYENTSNINIRVARIFATVGPFLDLNSHFAIGNFIRDAIHNKPIIVNSSGSAIRSYLYITDLIVMLWYLLLSDANERTYNVGSDVPITIRELAYLVSETLGAVECKIIGQDDKGWNPGRYIPDMTKMSNEFGIGDTVGLREGILRTAIWNGWSASAS